MGILKSMQSELFGSLMALYWLIHSDYTQL
jgi:hypothetical protein